MPAKRTRGSSLPTNFLPAQTSSAQPPRSYSTAPADDIAIVPSASYGTATAARNVPVKKGQSILVLAEQFPSNYYPWQRLADETGAALKVVAWPEDEDNEWTAAF